MTSTSKLNDSKPCSALKTQIKAWMQECRTLTLALFDTVTDEVFCQQAHPEFSPIGWHLGHIAYTESRWLLEDLAGLPPQSPPAFRRLFAADGLPKSERVALPAIAEVQAYLAATRTQVFNYLDIAPIAEQERLWRWLLQHESQHCETISLVLAILKFSQPTPATLPSLTLPSLSSNLQPATPDAPEMIRIAGGDVACGNEAIEALDNERPVHRVQMKTFWIDRIPVTCAQYRAFMAAGGYQDWRWWSLEGWAWLQTVPVTQPLYWPADRTYDNHPVCGVSWYEADAYARFVGKRLPTEAEWETAACWNAATQHWQPYPWGHQEPTAAHCNHSHYVGATTAIDLYPQNRSPAGCSDMLGNVWEWTATWFDGYPGFEAYPYRGYSQAYFDRQHRILRGGSWATRKWSLRGSFRNWYHPQVREILAGFRCAAD